MLVLNAALGVIHEYRSENALARLETLAAPVAWALRDGRLVHIQSRQLVPGDAVGATWVAAELINRLIRLRLAAGRVPREAT